MISDDPDETGKELILSFSSPDFDYNPDLRQILIGRGGAFQGTRSRISIPFNYDQRSPSGGAL